MTLRLVIEHSPVPQARTERLHEAGELTIGRGGECDWQIDDPEQFVSRRHCVISGEGDRFTVTDASRGGVFLDGSDRPLGAGNSAPLEHGMRLRLGDVVIRAEIARAEPRRVASAPAASGSFGGDDFFTPRTQPEPPPRPEALPQPFERARTAAQGPAPSAAAPPPPRFDDPFTLGRLSPAPAAAPSAVPPVAPPRAPGSPFGSFFDEPEPEAAPVMEDQTPATTPPVAEPALPSEPVPEPPPAAPLRAASPAPVPSEAALRDAFYRGLGIAPPGEAGAPEAEMEALGRRFRLLTEGLLHLLRTRSKEKMNVRVAQTVIGNADVNPLKFVATSDEAIAALVAHRGKGYLDPDAAINGAIRDLTDHQMRTWSGLQAALRAMIDRFDPAAFEAETEAKGLMRALIQGGRSAQLWQLYTERYREIARSAEDRFLGEVGADFRDSYEGVKRKEDGQ